MPDPFDHPRPHSRTPFHHRFPDAGLDSRSGPEAIVGRRPGPLPIRIDDERTAGDLARRISTVPHVDETVAVLLDHDRTPIGVLRVSDTDVDDAVLDVVRLLSTSVADRPGRIGGVVLVSVRPGRSIVLTDADRWLAIDDELEAAGCELVEWFVVGVDVTRPRELVGAPARWTRGRGAPPAPSIRCRTRDPRHPPREP